MRYKSNKSAKIGWQGSDDELAVSTYHGDGSTHRLDDFRTLEILEYGLEPRTEEELLAFVTDEFDVDDADAERWLETLLDDELLLPSDHSFHEASAEWFDKRWRQALYYHSGTRNVDPDEVREPTGEVVDDAVRRIRDTVDGTVVELPDPGSIPDRPTNEVMLDRRTHRTFAGEPFSAQTLSTLLYYSFEKARKGRRKLARADDPDHATVATHLPFEVYLVVQRNEDVETGVYRYDVREHELVRVRTFESPAEADDRIVEVTTDQSYPQGAGVTVVFTTPLRREMERYRHSRGLQNAYVQAAVQSHRVILTAVSMDLRAFLTPALRDTIADDLVGVDGFEEAVTYTTPVGK